MKKLLFCLMLSLPILAFAQVPKPFNVVGKFGTLNAKIYLGYQLGSNRVLDSAQAVNGSFEFKGDLIYPSPAIMIVDYKGVGANKLDVGDNSDKLTFYLDKGTITLKSVDSAYKAQIIGSPINDQYQKLLAINAESSAKTNQLMTDAVKSADDKSNTVERQNQLQAKLKAIQANYHAALKNFILTNPNSYLSLLSLSSLGGPSPDPNEIEPLLNGLSKEIRETETARTLKNALENLKATAIGAMAPDFEQTDTLNRPVRLSSFKGKYVLLDFWASWCVPCRQENPNVVKAYNRFKDKNFTIIGISLDKRDGAFAWMNAIRQDHLNWTQLSDLKFWNNAVAQLYFVQGIPKNFLIDPSGKIIAQDLRGDDLEAKLEEVLGKI
ncbi:MAG TPA: TlpA disulfide reductase family protein [Mucilaginibacter sp.]|nr:TlpA disulfide reductase family protein [Mucilaginibacter sp.]